MNVMGAEVVIVGAGPVGLTLAIELRLHGVRALVLERLAEPTGLSKALGLIGRSVDLIPLDPAKIAGLGLRGLFIQQAVTEEVLTATCRLGGPASTPACWTRSTWGGSSPRRCGAGRRRGYLTATAPSGGPKGSGSCCIPGLRARSWASGTTSESSRSGK